jgi:hypothetical protein
VAGVDVRCRFCAATHSAVTDAENPGPVIVIVRRYHALSDPGLSQRDFQVLPYQRPSDTLALLPYAVVTQTVGPYGPGISDRGLNLGDSLLLDQGAPAYDLAGTAGDFSAVPGRAAQGVAVAPPSAAYQYGNEAGGGTFALDERGDEPGAAAFDSGVDGALAAYERFGALSPSVAESRDDVDGATRRRGGLTYENGFAGGVLRIDAASASVVPDGDSLETAQFESLLHAAYATASRRYRTFVDLSADRIGVEDADEYGLGSATSSAVTATLRVEHPATITTAFGLVGQRATGWYSLPALGAIAGQFSSNAAYVEAQGGGARASFDAGASVAQTDLETANGGHRRDDPLTLVVPSITGQYGLGDGFSLHLSASGSFRAATLTELEVMPAAPPSAFERGSLIDTGVDFDDASRIKVGAMAFQENLSGFADRDTTGMGLTLAWQVSPLFSLRAWTLHDAAESYTTPLLYLPPAPLSLSRGVVWASYESPGGVRVDAIVRREVEDGPSTENLDGDIVLPIGHGLGVTVGTARIAERRTVYAGLRLP